MVVAESPGNGVGCVVDAVDFVDAPALSPAPPPQAGEGRKQVGSETLPGSPARAKQPRRPSPPSGKTNVDNHKSVIYNIVYTLNRFCRQFSRHINNSPWRTAQSSEGPRVAYRQDTHLPGDSDDAKHRNTRRRSARAGRACRTRQCPDQAQL
ncbi:hypothetical protein CBM2592_B10156 [Cupriavidus taiwanensis]|nr:hypothetical protein CBM2588_B10153 [Cupriavidus taiwanensis]SOY59892.1 hypothetical protein CBM2592_B10156 [Cupriavidus taiwanensis]SOY91932.1 hypothetical protein CBM2591_B10156 [Cupriavidus taiwanensis]SOZ73594.1 hypothetical protein CBM2617_B190157 [Cupriavidus taiwanensis]SOZ83481.1 hypothetical protein CBM2618_B10155 [Cupriavidus taiwanensis]